jgi:hypothetical protein
MNGWTANEDNYMRAYEDFGPRPENDELPTVREAVAAVQREIAAMHRELDLIEATLAMMRRVLEQETQAS